MTQATVTLPDTLSGLLFLAIDDMRKVYEDPSYMLEMGEWHCPSGTKNIAGYRNILEVCEVCMVGSILAKTFDYDPKHYLMRITDLEMPEEIINKFVAIDLARCGQFSTALETMGIDPQNPGVTHAIDIYKDHSEQYSSYGPHFMRTRGKVRGTEEDSVEFEKWLKLWRRIAEELHKAGV